MQHQATEKKEQEDLKNITNRYAHPTDISVPMHPAISFLQVYPSNAVAIVGIWAIERGATVSIK